MMSRTAGSVAREGVVDSDPEAIAALALIRKVICLAAELSGGCAADALEILKTPPAASEGAIGQISEKRFGNLMKFRRD